MTGGCQLSRPAVCDLPGVGSSLKLASPEQEVHALRWRSGTSQEVMLLLHTLSAAGADAIPEQQASIITMTLDPTCRRLPGSSHWCRS